jgi:hypothetical protein
MHIQSICYLSLRHDFALHSGDETATYTTYLFIIVFSAFTNTPTSLLGKLCVMLGITGFFGLCVLQCFFRIAGDGQNPSQEVPYTKHLIGLHITLPHLTHM